MRVINARNVNDAYRKGMQLMKGLGDRQTSRYGDVLVAPCPVTTVYERPTERVLFDPERDANPFFHFMEGLWMLAGRNDVEWISQFSGKIAEFSDDGEIFHGAYGYRWRNHFEADQLDRVVDMLRTNPGDRRAVLSMWDAGSDLGREGKDFPCNTQIMFRVRGKVLDMTVCNRSNDIIWGCYGANAVHMSMLQEYMAARIGVDVGVYYQVSNNWHTYTAVWDKTPLPEGAPSCAYELNDVYPYKLVSDPKTFDTDLHYFMTNPMNYVFYSNTVFADVAVPMMEVWHDHKRKNYGQALVNCRKIKAVDWRKACTEWIERRNAKHVQNNPTGR